MKKFINLQKKKKIVETGSPQKSVFCKIFFDDTKKVLFFKKLLRRFFCYHIMINNDKNFTQKNAKKFYCEKCDFTTSKKSDFDRHLLTRKHKMITNDNKKTQKNAEFSCTCGKIYKHHSGLSRHKLKCNFENKNDEEEKQKNEKIEKNDDNDKLMQMLKESTETNNKLAEKIKELEKHHIINNTTINNNQKVNVNLFLNEDCKYAISMNDFINMIQPSIDDLMYTKTNGYIKGITNIFTQKLNEFEAVERPIHSIQNKADKSYFIKENGEWEEDSNGDKLDQSIDSVARKQINKIKEWQNNNPDWNTTDQGISDYMEIVQNVMGGITEKERIENRNLIKKELTENIDISTNVNN